MEHSQVQTLCGTSVLSVEQTGNGAILHTQAHPPRHFDEVVMACHADQSLQLLANADTRQKQLLGSFSYQNNRAILHTDTQLMPDNRKAWASWNYQSGSDNRVSVSYWMNLLQRLPARENYMVTLNPVSEPDPATIVNETVFEHPVFDQAACEAQTTLHEIQGAGSLWFCGAWCGYGFHEDGLRSGVEVAGKLGCIPPWEMPVTESTSASINAPVNTAPAS